MARTYGISLTEFASGQAAPQQPQQHADADADEDMLGSSDDDVDVPDELAGGAGGSMHGGVGKRRGMLDTAGPSTSTAMHDGAGPSWRSSAAGSAPNGGRATAGSSSSWAHDLLNAGPDDAGGGEASGRRSRAARAAGAHGGAGPSTSAGGAGGSGAMSSDDDEDAGEGNESDREGKGAAGDGDASEEDWMHEEAVDDEATLEEEEQLAGAEGCTVRLTITSIFFKCMLPLRVNT
jgi:hypothetical protein